MRILIVDDQQIVRQGLRLMLEQDDQVRVTREAENGQEAIKMLEKHLFDLVLMDIRMPIMNGIEATRRIKRKWPKVKVLILTTFNDEDYALESLRDGADGFLLKTANSEELIKAIKSCLSGGLVLHDEVSAKLMPKLLERHKVEIEDFDLTERELSITKLIGEGKTNQEIAEELYLSVGTVKNYLTRILAKTNFRDRTQLAIFAVRSGLVE